MSESGRCWLVRFDRQERLGLSEPVTALFSFIPLVVVIIAVAVVVMLVILGLSAFTMIMGLLSGVAVVSVVEVVVCLRRVVLSGKS